MLNSKLPEKVSAYPPVRDLG